MDDDLITFLRARLDEDEQMALTSSAMAGERWDCTVGIGDSVHNEFGSAVVIGPYEYLDDSLKIHIARHDPARVLADVDAKRRILDWETWPGIGQGARDGCEHAAYLLALPYADHPDYREDWRP